MAEIVLEVVHRIILYFTLKSGRKASCRESLQCYEDKCEEVGVRG